MKRKCGLNVGILLMLAVVNLAGCTMPDETGGKEMTVQHEEAQPGDATGLDRMLANDEGQILAEIPEQGITMYGYNDEEYLGQGVVIKMDEDVSYFDWTYLSPRCIFPEMYWNEELKQLQVALNIYSGTGVSAQQFHILQRYETGTFEDCVVDIQDYSALLGERLKFDYDGEKQFLIILDKRNDSQLAEIDVSWMEGRKVEGIFAGEISNFRMGEQIWLEFVPGYQVEGWDALQYENMPTMEVEFNIKSLENREFELGEMEIIESNEELSGMEMASSCVAFGECKDYWIRLIMTEGCYYTEIDSVPGGGTYNENYEGEYILEIRDENNRILDEYYVNQDWGYERINFPGKFDLCVSDYNADGLPDFTIGNYGSSSMNIFALYSVDKDGKISKIGHVTDVSKDYSIYLIQEQESTDIYTTIWNNATGEEETVVWKWSEDGKYVEKTNDDRIKLSNYHEALQDFEENGILPDGEFAYVVNDFKDVMLSANHVALQDVDMDGRDELLISVGGTCAADMGLYVYEYREEKNNFHRELSACPGTLFYTNGSAEMYLPVNQGYAGTDVDFWPYYMLRYDADADKYVTGMQVYAWEKVCFPEIYKVGGFPDTIDMDGDGLLYLLYENDDTIPQILDNSQYESWYRKQVGEAEQIDINMWEVQEILKQEDAEEASNGMITIQNVDWCALETVMNADEYEALQNYMPLLTGDEKFIWQSEEITQSVTMDEFRYLLNNEYFDYEPDELFVHSVAVCDLDQAGVKELILELHNIGGRYLIFHNEDGVFYGTDRVIRGFLELQTNGSFIAAGGAAYNYYHQLQFRDDKFEEIELGSLSWDDESEEMVFYIGEEKVDFDIFSEWQNNISSGNVVYYEVVGK